MPNSKHIIYYLLIAMSIVSCSRDDDNANLCANYTNWQTALKNETEGINEAILAYYSAQLNGTDQDELINLCSKIYEAYQNWFQAANEIRQCAEQAGDSSSLQLTYESYEISAEPSSDCN